LSAVAKISNLLRHGRSKAHYAAFANRFGGGVPGAPAASEFKAALEDRIAGKAYRQACGESAAEKSASITWCLGEAMRDDERRFFRKAVSVAIHQDGQGSKLCVVYCAATETEVRTGILGMAKDFGTNAKEITAATVRILKDACTRRLQPPRKATCESAVDVDLFSRMKSRVELFDADNAADEQKAGRILAGRDGVAGDFPNIKVQLQDKTHAATRLTMKPWCADPFLNETFQCVVRQSNSITGVIFHSDTFKAIFNARVLQTVDGPVDGRRVRDLQSAPHRFASTQKPLGRLLMWLDAVIATAHEIVARRGKKKKEHESARRFLDMVVDPERLIALAMLADAGDECSGLIRFFDSRFDVAETPHVISTFLHKVDCLFLRREVEKCQSYTAHTLKTLRGRQRLVIDRSGGFVTVGGPGFVTDSVMDKCYARMATWVRLAAKSIAAEFPSWELLQAFGVFGLNPAPSASFVEESLARLAQTFGVNGVSLASEFADFQRTAKSAYDQSATGALAVHRAWLDSLRRVMQNTGQRKAHPFDTLAKVVARYGAFCGASTTSVERTFAVSNHQIGPHRKSMNLTLQVYELKLRMELVESTGDKLINAAQAIWAECFGVARRSGHLHRDRRWVAGKLAMSSAAKRSEASWLRRRRASVTSVAQKPIRAHAVVAEVAGRLGRTMWTEVHAEVERKLDEIGNSRRLAANEFGALLPHERPTDEEVAQNHMRVVTNAREYDVRKAALARTLSSPAGNIAHAACVHV